MRLAAEMAGHPRWGELVSTSCPALPVSPTAEPRGENHQEKTPFHHTGIFCNSPKLRGKMLHWTGEPDPGSARSGADTPAQPSVTSPPCSVSALDVS